MKQKKIIENNKLIAEFMGFPKVTIGSIWKYNKSLCNSQNTVVTVKSFVTSISGTSISVIFKEEMPYNSYGIEYFDGNIFKPKNLQENDHSPCKPYHSSWDWLMPVVEKIEQLKYGVTIHETECDIYNLPDQIILFNEDGKNKLLGVYNTIVKFIKWYNMSKNKL